jgi:hypothetical protein
MIGLKPLKPKMIAYTKIRDCLHCISQFTTSPFPLLPREKVPKWEENASVLLYVTIWSGDQTWVDTTTAWDI